MAQREREEDWDEMEKEEKEIEKEEAESDKAEPGKYQAEAVAGKRKPNPLRRMKKTKPSRKK